MTSPQRSCAVSAAAANSKQPALAGFTRGSPLTLEVKGPPAGSGSDLPFQVIYRACILSSQRLCGRNQPICHQPHYWQEWTLFSDMKSFYRIGRPVRISRLLDLLLLALLFTVIISGDRESCVHICDEI